MIRELFIAVVVLSLTVTAALSLTPQRVCLAQKAQLVLSAPTAFQPSINR
jgi:hypothetical protein